MHLKSLDWEIVRELLRWQGNQPEGALRFPVADLARRTRAHPNTVRARLAALRAGGVVEGATFDVWPRAAGLVRSGWMLSGARPPSGDAMLRFLARHPYVNGAPYGLDWAFPHLWTRDDAEAERLARQMARELGMPHVERHFTSTEFPPSPADAVHLSPLDWRLILALRRGPQRSLAAVARQLRVTPRTAERRARRLFDAGAGGMFPLLRPARIEGAVVVHVNVVEGDARAPASLARAFPHRLAGPWGRGINAGVMAHFPNLAAAEETREAAERLPGLARLSLIVYRDILYSPAFDDYLEGHVASQQGAVARA